MSESPRSGESFWARTPGRLGAHLKRHPWSTLTSLILLVLAGFTIARPGSPLLGVMMILLGVNQLFQHVERTRDGSPSRWTSPGVAGFCVVVGVAIVLTTLLD